MASIVFLCLLFCVIYVSADYYDTFNGIKITRRRYEEMRNMSLVPWCAIQVAHCDPHENRRMDLTCNNLKHPSYGAIATPLRRILPAYFQDGKRAVRLSVSGRPLPPPRALRVALLSDGRVPSHTHTQLTPVIALLNVADTTSIHDTVNYIGVTTNCCLPGGQADPRCAPMAVADNDLHLFASDVRCLNLTTPISFQDMGCLPDEGPLEKINIAAPMLELSNVYGFEEPGAASGRLFEGGLLRSEVQNGQEWPPSGSPVCINNEPPNETRCHASPNAGGANSLFGVNLSFMWMYRQHNWVARALADINPCWDDDQLYYTAREINIALSNQIYYYEFLSEIMSTEYLLRNKLISPDWGHYNDYDASLEPRMAVEYPVAMRWFHTIQDSRLKMYTQKGVLYDEKAIVDFTLRTGGLSINGTIQGLTQGTFRQPTGAVDGVIDPDMGMRVLGRLQRVSDALSSDISKGRLLGVAPYLKFREYCGLPAVRGFDDLLQWMDQEQVDALSQQYESVQDIDFVAGIFAELPLTKTKEKREHMSEREGHMSEIERDMSEREVYMSEREGDMSEREVYMSESEGDMSEREGHMSESEGHMSKREGNMSERQGKMSEEEKHMLKKRMRYWSDEALAGPTLACVLTDQLLRFRRADRFWYEHADHPQAFTRGQLREIRKNSLAAILCRFGDGVTYIQRRALRLPGHGNELEPCASILKDGPNLSVFADNTCRKHSPNDPFKRFKH